MIRKGVGLAVGGTAEVLEVAREALSCSPYPAVRQVDVQSREGAVVLSGQVASYYHKQMAQEALKALRGTSLIVNELVVCGPKLGEAA
jgi:osmotically-inducible protein OsmY